MTEDDETVAPSMLPGEPGHGPDLSLQAHHEANHDHMGRDGGCWCCCFRCTEDPALFARIEAFWTEQQRPTMPEEDA